MRWLALAFLFLAFEYAQAKLDTREFDHNRVCYYYAQGAFPQNVKRVMATPRLPADIQRHVRRLVGEYRGDHCSRKQFWLDIGRIGNVQIAYKDDSNNHWQTAEETFALRTGDCEDYAIAKYWMARFAGCPADQMYVTSWHHVPPQRTGHATLIVKLGSRYLNLDNRSFDDGRRTTELSHLALRMFYSEREVGRCF